jgi:hypothetical protein
VRGMYALGTSTGAAATNHREPSAGEPAPLKSCAL